MEIVTFNKRKNFSSIENIKKFINKEFKNYIKNFEVKLLFENEIVKTWLFISDDHFLFVFDNKSTCIIYKFDRKKFIFNINQFNDKPKYSKLRIIDSDMSNSIIIDNTIAGDIEKIINDYIL